MKVCANPGCDNPLRAHNVCGYCKECNNQRRVKEIPGTRLVKVSGIPTSSGETMATMVRLPAWPEDWA